jgi:hypothetical protein
MVAKPIPAVCLFVLTASAFLLLVSVGVVLGIAAIVDAMGDATGGSALRWIGLGLGAALLVDLICLVLALGVNGLTTSVSETTNAADELTEEK